jgi:hypothetical protein
MCWICTSLVKNWIWKWSKFPSSFKAKFCSKFWIWKWSEFSFFKWNFVKWWSLFFQSDAKFIAFFFEFITCQNLKTQIYNKLKFCQILSYVLASSQKYKRMLHFFFTFIFTSRQIWLNHLLDGRYFDYITKLNQKNTCMECFGSWTSQLGFVNSKKYISNQQKMMIKQWEMTKNHKNGNKRLGKTLKTWKM